MDKDVKSRGIHIQWIGLVRFYRAGSTVGATDSSSSVVDRISRATLPYLWTNLVVNGRCLGNRFMGTSDSIYSAYLLLNRIADPCMDAACFKTARQTNQRTATASVRLDVYCLEWVFVEAGVT